MGTMADLQAIRFKQARSILDKLKVQNRFPELDKAGSSCRDEGVHVHTVESRKNENNCLKDLSLSQNASFSEE